MRLLIGLLTYVLLSPTEIQAVEEDVQHFTEVLYEELSNGTVKINKFSPMPSHMNLALIIGDFNPSPRFPSCERLNVGRFPVYGDCSRFLECDENLTRRIIQCMRNFWFRPELKEGCGPQNTNYCPYGRLVPNEPQLLSDMVHSVRKRSKRNIVKSPCSRDGVFPLPGCHGYYTCEQRNASSQVFSYSCDEGLRWNGQACRPQETVKCNVPEEDSACIRECIPGNARVCRYTFIVEEFASMSIYCKRCPFVPEDCNLPSCVPAGGISKPIVTINRRIPGNVIHACKGDTIEVEVQNHLHDGSTTIHWHGLHQITTPHMDGVPYITQCPIQPGHQESDGMFGAMIIREPRSAEFGISQRYDEDLPEHYMLIWHWSHRRASTEAIDTAYMSLKGEGYSFLINGKGTANKLFDEDGEQVYMPMETFHVKTGIRYRFRVIFNSALYCPIQLSIDNHVLDILASDGRPLMSQTSSVDSVFLNAGERMDFVAHPQDSVRTVGRSFYIRVRGLNYCDDRRNGAFQTAILRYDNSTINPVAPMSYGNSIRSGVGFNLNEDLYNSNNFYIHARPLTAAKDANPLPDSAIAGIPNQTYYVRIGFESYTSSEGVEKVLPQLNQIKYIPPNSPPLMQSELLVNETFCRPDKPFNCQNGLCSCTQMLKMNKGELIEMILVDEKGEDDIGHPFHMHGFAFRVVAMYKGRKDISVNQVQKMNNEKEIRKYFNGPLKDTVVAPTRGYVIIRFLATNPGYWLFHCHISSHMQMGMALVLKVGQHSEMVKPPNNFPTCGNFY